MLTIDLGAETEIEVTYAQKTYRLREPTVSEIRTFQEVPEGQTPDVISFLSKIGLPIEVAQSLPISKVQVLIEGIVEGISKKK